ncbi:ABC transporter ATP-binding protein [Sulfobacillus sp. hq2]|uniref:ABC transporter ATP-binding protein n=1 Tax=Sulfobacillus sp. hq2 TaxID=2039167 RepID=UPI000CD11362|nr:ATP-binding cassette domain-containing protein [Sulfobacillus sp. hq2]POB10548.1 hypothetical protein CO251_09570 [Sulfobacillus sp. hq2]
MARVTFRNVMKTFGSHDVLAPLSFEVADGEFFVIVGPSGSGKSTTLRLVAGLERPSQGEIYFDTERVDQWLAHARDVGMVFQNYAIYPHMSVYNNMSFGLEAQRTPKNTIAQRIQQVAALLEIDQLLSKRPSELSGGQKQRVALGRALVRNPRVFLMDEPLSNLDAQLRDHMRTEIRLLHDRLKITTIYVTHDQTEAMTMADRIMVMDQGRIQQIGTPTEIYAHPSTTFVAKFFGSPSMNIVPGRIGVDKNMAWFKPTHCPEIPLSLPTTVSSLFPKHSISDTVYMGFRPEDIVLKPLANALTFPFEPTTIESLGSHCQTHGHWHHHPISLTHRNSESFQRHQETRLSVLWSNIHWFAGENGLRITTPGYDDVRQEVLTP